MKGNTRYFCTTLIFSLLLGILVSVLYFFRFISIDNFDNFFGVLIAISGVLLFGILFTIAFAGRNRIFQEVYCYCGNLAVIGAAGTILTGLLTSLFYDSIYLYGFVAVGVGISFFFLGLLLGGIWCLLYNYIGCCVDEDY